MSDRCDECDGDGTIEYADRLDADGYLVTEHRPCPNGCGRPDPPMRLATDTAFPSLTGTTTPPPVRGPIKNTSRIPPVPAGHHVPQPASSGTSHSPDGAVTAASERVPNGQASLAGDSTQPAPVFNEVAPRATVHGRGA